MRLLCTVGALMLLPCALLLADDEAPVLRRPLDLPRTLPVFEESEEDEPETILFYGQELEGDVFLWCLPAYGFCGETDTFEAIKAEVANALGQLSSHAKMDLVAYNSTTYVWRPLAQRASSGNKASAVAWLGTLVPIESHCLLEAALVTLGISQATEGNSKVVVVLGARQPYCETSGGPEYAEQCLMEITAANHENSRINTVYFTTSFYSGEETFYIELAAMNGGTFRQVDY